MNPCAFAAQEDLVLASGRDCLHVVIGVFGLLIEVLADGVTLLYPTAVDIPLYPSCIRCTGTTPPACIRCLLAVHDRYASYPIPRLG